MKKYVIHGIYLLVIAALAIVSRIKTNELETEVLEVSAIAEKAAESATIAQMEAEAQAELAVKRAAEATHQSVRADRLAEELMVCKHQKN